DRRHLERHRPLRRHPERFRDACRRYAPLLGAPVLHAFCRVAALGAVNSSRFLSWTQVSRGAVEKSIDLDRPSPSIRLPWPHLLHVARDVGVPAESLGASARIGSVSRELAAQVLWRNAGRSDSLQCPPAGGIPVRLARQARFAASRNRAPQRAALESSAQRL